VEAVALVQPVQQEEQVAVTVALVQHISQPFMLAAAAVVGYLLRTETEQADLEVVAMAVAEREPMALAAAAVDRLQIFQARQVHQRQEKVAMGLSFSVIPARQLALLLVRPTRQHKRVATPFIPFLKMEHW
jgi:hypothetical protein